MALNSHFLSLSNSSFFPGDSLQSPKGRFLLSGTIFLSKKEINENGKFGECAKCPILQL